MKNKYKQLLLSLIIKRQIQPIKTQKIKVIKRKIRIQNLSINLKLFNLIRKELFPKLEFQKKNQY